MRDSEEIVDRLCSRWFRRQWKLILGILVLLFCVNIYCALQLLSKKDQGYSSPYQLIKQAFESQNVNRNSATEEEYEFGPRCEFSDSALDVFKRMKTTECKKKLEDHLCDMDPVGWPVRTVNNTCSIYLPKIQYQYRGCYRDSTASRTLKFFKYDLKATNSPNQCAQFCFRIGATLSGVEYGYECFCGHEKDLTDLSPLQNASVCEEMKCPGDETKFCGGFNAIALYNTGLTHHNREYPVYVDPEKSKRDVKILFLLQLNGRNVRQIKRLLKAIYNPRHLYLVHVDARQKLMHYEMLEIQKILERSGQTNFRVVTDRFITIWGGTSLLDMFLHIVRTTLEGVLKGFEDWDYIFNLSECDYPILSIQELEAVLTENKGKSFISAHGYNTGTFLKKQGYNYHFFECEERMWRVGQRNNYPQNLRVDGGSDWVIIHRDLAIYSISEEKVCKDLRKFFKTILLPLEGFFHTLALNTGFCDKVLYKNLRLTNWKRDQGCRCEGLKHVVDWCGCSPVTILAEENKLFVERLKNKTNYFARKFDWMVDPVTIQEAENNVFRFEKHRLNEYEGVHDGWVSLYDRRYDDPKTLPDLTNLAQVLSSRVIQGDCDFSKLLEINMFLSFDDKETYEIFKIEDSCGEIQEFKVARLKKRIRLAEKKIVNGYELKMIEMGNQLDLKEEIFRDDLTLITEDSSVTFQWLWVKLSESEEKDKKKKRTSPKVLIEVLNSEHNLLHFNSVDSYNSINFKQHVKLDLQEIGAKSGVLTFVLKHPVTKEALLQFPFAVLPKEINPTYHRLIDFTYNVTEKCSTNCPQMKWSTFRPAKSSDIRFGFDEKLNSLV
ncbi:unnamed protein product [Bursaphelenchus xylophilus]|uniref:protein xylosyltransferase n=1 Tax=Bursaphelenchus xylophilus TaxID=6326 RepID=A0A1I7RNR9_BURXY|nr:unnamed protein product [Bursaphelenchus xylophilus]CAG9124248.1 unnamed protein product [Bursaphelenchus xylophilus]